MGAGEGINGAKGGCGDSEGIIIAGFDGVRLGGGVVVDGGFGWVEGVGLVLIGDGEGLGTGKDGVGIGTGLGSGFGAERV